MSLINSTPRTTSLNTLQNGSDPAKGNVVCGFDTVAGFEAIQRMANLFSASSIVPENYRSKGANDYTSKGNCVIALDMALRMGANPLMVMQNLYVVHGRPAWSAQFLIATLNKSGKFSALRYAFQGTEGTDELVQQVRQQMAEHPGAHAAIPGRGLVRALVCPGDRHGPQDRRRSAGHHRPHPASGRQLRP